MGACATQVSVVNMSAEIGAHTACASACPTQGTCALTDCTCGAACVRMQSAAFQAAFEAMITCFDAEIAADCY